MNKKVVRFFKLFNKKGDDKNPGSYGQASMETLAVAGFAILIFVVAIVMFYYYSGSSQDALTEGQAEKVVNTLVAKADELAVYDIGFSTQIQLDIPQGLEDDIIFGIPTPDPDVRQANPEISLKIKTSNDAISTIAGRATFANIEGRISKTPGLKTVSLCSKEGKVCIVELQPGQSCLNAALIKNICPGLESTITARRSTSCNNGRRDVNEVCDGVIFNESAPLCQQNEVRSCVSCNVTCTPAGTQPTQPTQPGIQSVTYTTPYVLEGNIDESYPSAIIRKVNGIPDDFLGVNNEDVALYDKNVVDYSFNPVYEKFLGLLNHEGEWICTGIGTPCIDKNNPDNYDVTGAVTSTLTLGIYDKIFSSSNSNVVKIEYILYDYSLLSESDYDKYKSIKEFIITLSDGTKYYYDYPVYVINKNGLDAVNDDSLVVISNDDNAFTKGDYTLFSYKSNIASGVNMFSSKFFIDRYAYAWLLTKIEKPGQPAIEYRYSKRRSEFIAPYETRLMYTEGENQETSQIWPDASSSDANVQRCRNAIRNKESITAKCWENNIQFTHGYMEIAKKV